MLFVYPLAVTTSEFGEGVLVKEDSQLHGDPIAREVCSCKTLSGESFDCADFDGMDLVYPETTVPLDFVYPDT